MVSKEQYQTLAEAILSTGGFRQTAYMADVIAERVIELGWTPPEEVLTPAQEIDWMDRIISGLPLPRRVLSPANPDGPAIYKKQRLDIVFPDGEPIPEAPPSWVKIPDFENYEICKDGEVRNRWTKRLMEVEYENCASYIEMHDKQGFSHKVSTMTLAAIAEEIFG